MHDAEVNKRYVQIFDNLLDYRQSHQHINMKEKKQVLQFRNPKPFEELKLNLLKLN